ncbi:MAG: response regulator [Pseudomonadota bacterium]
MKLKNIWNLRFHNWLWLFVPVLIGLGTTLICMQVGILETFSVQLLTICFSITLLAIAVAMIGMVHVGRPQRDLLRAARSLAQGRLEARVPNHFGGITGQLAEQIATLGKQLKSHRDHIDGSVVQMTSHLRQDQQRLQTLNEELLSALAESRKAAATQAELFSNLSHELRTPLTAILGYTDLIRRSGLNREQELHIATVGKSARGMLGMINDLLDWSRIEAGQLQFNEDTLDINEAVEDVTALLAPLAYDKDLELVRIVYHDVPTQLRGDPQRLRQILTNLLSNAIKFTNTGGIVLRVLRERDEQDKVWVSFSVTDTGVGIAPEQQNHLFQAFHQASGTVGGSGLGLSITRKLAELMGGNVEMKSIVGEGSTFSVMLPFNSTEASSAPASAEPHLRERQAWVLEPHATARLALTHWLEFWGMHVHSFESITELNTALITRSPDVVIVGMKEKDHDDPDYLAAFQRCTWRKPPLLALIASSSIDMHARVREAGAANCLPKSVSQLGLFRELVNLTSLKPAQKQPLAGRRVLIADNNTVNRRYIATLCGELALTVQEAADGREALRYWRNAATEYVLLDARMPEVDGLNCVRAIRAETVPGTLRSRIIVISAHLEPNERKALLAAGADGVLLKPFDGRELLRTLAPQLVAPPPPVSAMLTADPEMLVLLREELPIQIRELEEALFKNDLTASRDAAHQLRGTAAFYHLTTLKQVTSAFDLYLLQLHSLQNDPVWPGMLAEIRTSLDQVLNQLNNRLSFSS